MVLKVIDGNRVLYLKSTDRQFQDDLEKIFCGKIKLKLVDEIRELTDLQQTVDNQKRYILDLEKKCTEIMKKPMDQIVLG